MWWFLSILVICGTLYGLSMLRYEYECRPDEKLKRIDDEEIDS